MNSCRKARVSPSIESWVELGSESARLDAPQLANEIENAIREAWKVRAPCRADAVPKFSEKLSLESLDKFHLGLENFIGYPPTNSNFLDLMKREHEQGKKFQNQGSRDVDPKVEWNIVMRSEAWNITGAGCEPSFEIKKREIGKPLDFYTQKAKRVFSDALAFGEKKETLTEAEVAALRLWTGPMHKEYARVLRNPTKPSGPYVTTLHALNSGITKLARIWRLPASRKVYRGYRNLSLKELKKDAFQCVGGVEKSVLATSDDFNIAVQYSGDGAFILEMDVGQVNRGADVSWLSQFPHEKEILFNALSNVEFICSPQLRFVQGRGTILVYQVCVSANLKSKTLEEFVRLPKDLHLNLVDVLTQEVRRMINLREEESRYGLIKLLGAECRKQCHCIVTNADKADVGVFNEGEPAYLTLVEDAILLKSRALHIIDLALNWIETRQADLSALDGLQDWQLEALSTALRSGNVFQVTKLVLEKDWKPLHSRSEVSLQIGSFFSAESLDLGVVHKSVTVCRVAKLLTLNPNLNDLKMECACENSEDWENVFKQLCPARPRLRVNGFLLAECGSVNTLQQLDLRNFDIQMAAVIAPAFQFHASSALTSLSLCGSPIGCTGAESLGRAFCNMQKLQYVDLRSCKIADRGCTGISHGLPALTKLEDLNLTHNNVKDDGFHILAAAMRTVALSRLKSVDMRRNDTLLPSLRCGPRCVMRNRSNDHNITCVAWSPGGGQFVSGGGRPPYRGRRDGDLMIWDANSCDVVTKLKGHSGMVTSVSWCPVGDHIASGSWDHTVIIWNAKSGEKILTLKGHTNIVTSVAWCPGGDQVASASDDKTIIIWDAKTGYQVSTLKGHTQEVTSVAWRPGGDQIAGGSEDMTTIIWDTKTGEQVLTLKGHNREVSCVAWSPGGGQISSGSYDDTIIIWDSETGEQVLTLKGHSKGVTSLSWHPGDDQLASGSYDGTIIIWDAAAGVQISTIKEHTGDVTCVSWHWHPAGDQITSGSAAADDTGTIIIIICDTNSEEHVSMLEGHKDTVTSVAWRPGGDQIASGSYDNTIIIWDAKTGKQVSTLRGHTQPVMSVAWRAGGDQIVSGGCGQCGRGYLNRPGEIIIWDAKTGEYVSMLKGHSGPVYSVAWSPGGDQIVSGGCGAGGYFYFRSGEIIIWDAKTREQVSTLKGHVGTVTSVAWRPGGDQIASASKDETIIIWDSKTGEQISTLRGHTWEATCVAWRPGGDQIAGGSDDGTVIIWDVKTREQVSTLKGHTLYVTSVAWRPGGDQIACGLRDHTIIIWDAKTGEQVSILKGHTDAVTSVDWCPGGDQIASGSSDNTIIFWDAKTKDQVSLHLGALNEGQVVTWQSNSDASDHESVGAAIRLCRGCDSDDDSR